MRLPSLAAVCVVLMAAQSEAQAPQLLRQRDLQAPVRAAAGELLFLAGGHLHPDLAVTFRPLDGGETLRAGLVPGPADINALVVRVPSLVDTGRRYAIEVTGESGGPAAAVIVNDARPLWFLPRTLPTRGAAAGLEREIKIVGRNLAPSGIAATAVRLRGPRQVALVTISTTHRNVGDFLVRAGVPDGLPIGEYRIEVSRDERNWVALDDPLRIESAVSAPLVFEAADPKFGGCAPDDDRDDTACVVAALVAAKAAAARARNAEVHFGAGTWNLDDFNAGGAR